MTYFHTINNDSTDMFNVKASAEEFLQNQDIAVDEDKVNAEIDKVLEGALYSTGEYTADVDAPQQV